MKAVCMKEERPPLSPELAAAPSGQMVTRCWAQDPGARPAFAVLAKGLEAAQGSVADPSQARLLAAASHALAEYYSKPSAEIAVYYIASRRGSLMDGGHLFSCRYLEPPEGSPGGFYNDLDPVFTSVEGKPTPDTVHRPNHGLANAIRKAVLVPEVAAAYKAHYTGGAYGSFDFKSSQLLAMQVAMLFEVCGRENDAGFNDDPTQFMRFHAASCRAFDEYARSKGAGIDEAARVVCLEALERMYMSPASARSKPYKHVFETCHDLDLCRCYSSDKMKPKLAALARDVGQPACDALAQRAERAILATGDRLLFSPTGGSGRAHKAEVDPS